MRFVHYGLGAFMALLMCWQISNGNWSWVFFDAFMAPLLILTAPPAQ